jgi:uncharacterized delta-60 repeat protein
MKRQRPSCALHASIFEPLESRQMFAAGAPDPGFGFGSGKSGIGLPGRATAEDVAVQADGKTVVVGSISETADIKGNSSVVVARFNADGTVDRTFGRLGGGFIILHFSALGKDQGKAVAIQRDGNIVVVGTANLETDRATPKFAVTRLLPNGSVDRSFGLRKFTVKGASFAEDVAIQPDGKIVVVGSDFNGGIFNANNDFAIARLNRDGSLDKSFAGDGTEIIGMGEHERAFAVDIDTNGSPATNRHFGKIVLAGNRTDGDGLHQYAVARLNRNGSLDESFDFDGSLVAKFPGYSKAFVNGVTIQPDSKIVVAGHAIDGTSTDDTPIAVARHRTSGRIDSTFGAGSNGAAYIDFGADDVGGDVMLSSGGLIVAGSTNNDFALASLTKDGLLDTRFGTQGKVVTDLGIGRTVNLVAMAASPNKRIVVTGGNTFGLIAARYLDFGGFVASDKAKGPHLQLEAKPSGSLIVNPTGLSESSIQMGSATAVLTAPLRIFSQVRI